MSSLRLPPYHRFASRLGLIWCLLVLGGALIASFPVFALGGESQTGEVSSAVDSSVSDSSPSVARGRYLTHSVAMCVQCHSPRNARGELLEDKLFTGAPMPVKSPFAGIPRWAFTAPNLRNAPGYTEEEFLRFLMTGIRTNGQHPRGPMPPFRMNRGDAQAVYDYLMSF